MKNKELDLEELPVFMKLGALKKKRQKFDKERIAYSKKYNTKFFRTRVLYKPIIF
jgi:hypothetical protein